MKYELFVNGALAGSVETENIQEYMKGSNYSKAVYSIDPYENNVYISVDILDIMRQYNK